MAVAFGDEVGEGLKIGVVRAEVDLPSRSFRTGQAGRPHPALQSVDSVRPKGERVHLLLGAFHPDAQHGNQHATHMRI